MKHIFITLKCRAGEYEFYTSSVHKFEGDPLIFADEYARTFYEQGWDGDGDGNEIEEYGKKMEGMDQDVWFFFSGEVAVKLDSWSEITEEEFKIMNKYL